MRSLGLPELIVIAGIVMLLFGGKRLSQLLGSLGKRTKQAADQARWIYQSLGGTQEEEIEAEAPVGRRLAGEFLNQFPKDDDPVAQRRVERVGKRLVEAAGEKREFTFRVVRADIANAFALPGGHIFITRPLLDLCAGDDDQLAYLLGHEMSHVIRRHSAERFVTKAVLSALPVRGAIAELLDKGYSRDQELEADTGGAKLAVQAGFDSEGAVRALRRLEQVAPTGNLLSTYWSTHPPVDERVKMLESGNKTVNNNAG